MELCVQKQEQGGAEIRLLKEIKFIQSGRTNTCGYKGTALGPESGVLQGLQTTSLARDQRNAPSQVHKINFKNTHTEGCAKIPRTYHLSSSIQTRGYKPAETKLALTIARHCSIKTVGRLHISLCCQTYHRWGSLGQHASSPNQMQQVIRNVIDQALNVEFIKDQVVMHPT